MSSLAAAIALAAMLQCGATRTSAADTSPPAAVDQPTIRQAAALFAADRFVEAERLYRRILSAIDAGSVSRAELGRTLSPLVKIYRAWERNDEALKIAERYRKWLGDAATLDAQVRQNELDDVGLQIVDILSGLNRYDDAEHELADATKQEAGRKPGDPARRLLLLVKSAQLAEAAGDSSKAKSRWSQVVEYGKTTLAEIDKRTLSGKLLPECATALSMGYVALEDFPAAIALKQRLLAVATAQKDVKGEVKTRSEIATLHAQNRDFAAAQNELAAAIALEHKREPNSLTEAELLGMLAGVVRSQGFAAEAKRYLQASAAIDADALNKAERAENAMPAVMNLMARLVSVYEELGQSQEAVKVAGRLVEVRAGRLGNDHPLTVLAKEDLGKAYVQVENFQAAEKLLREVVDYWRRHPRSAAQLATALNDLAVAQRAIGSFPDARSAAEEALAIRTTILHADDLRLAYSLGNLASIYLAQGDFAKAISFYERAVAIYRGRGRAAEDSTANTLLTLAMAYRAQGQYKKAREYCDEALTTYQRVFGTDAPGAVSYYAALSSLDIDADRLDEAADFNRRAWELCQANHLDRDAIAATVLDQRARIAGLQHNLAAAADNWRQALPLEEAAGQSLQVAHTLNFLANVESARGNNDDAKSLYRRALAFERTVNASPAFFSTVRCNLAGILHDQGKAKDALELLSEAVKLTEVPRTKTSGAEEERAEYFAQFASAFDLLVAWNLEAGRIDDAFGDAERGRNRTFLDQLSLAGIDLRETLTGDAGKELLERERSLRTKLGTLRGQLQTAAAAADAKTALKNLSKEYSAAEDQFADVWTEIRNASPVYREKLGGSPIGSLDSIRHMLADSQEMMLFYYLGAKESHLLVIAGPEQKVNVIPLVIPETLAAGLKIKAGPLTRPVAVQIVNQYLSDLRDRGGGRGLAGIVHSPKGVMAAEQGTQLADVLLPRDLRKQIQRRQPRGITIVPDGALHQLPFEALLIEGGNSPRYLIDIFPPITYAPSATILANLQARPSAAGPATLLTVANPNYPQGPEKPAASTLAAVSRDAYLELGGRLPLLPGTSKECARVAAAFPAEHVKRLESNEATEAAVRANIRGRRYVHLAAHGLVDAQHNNLFGAIALTPGRRAADSTDDDGFLSLHEIHLLPLSGCELVVLSACQTNVGPDRPFEAGATLAQAFLAAGGKRVVCSHWNVDDASTAELMAAFFDAIAKAEREKKAVNFATALQEARKTVRANSRWASPYYWAPFVLVGPAD